MASNLVLRTVYLSPTVDDRLRDEAYNSRTSKNDLIRKYIEAGMKVMAAQSAAGKTPAKKAAGGRTAAKKAPAKKTSRGPYGLMRPAAKKAAAKKAPAKKAAAKKTRFVP